MIRTLLASLVLALSLGAQAEKAVMKMDAECVSNIRTGQSDAPSTIAPLQNFPSNKKANLGTFAGKTFSLLLEESVDGNPFPDTIRMTVSDAHSEITSSSRPDKDGFAMVDTVIKSAITGEIVIVNCKIQVKD